MYLAKLLRKQLIRERAAVIIQKRVRGFLARLLYERMQAENAAFQKSTVYIPALLSLDAYTQSLYQQQKNERKRNRRDGGVKKKREYVERRRKLSERRKTTREEGRKKRRIGIRRSSWNCNGRIRR